MWVEREGPLELGDRLALFLPTQRCWAPEPALPELTRPWNLLITGVGGTGVVTIGSILACAAHFDGKGVGMMEMAGMDRPATSSGSATTGIMLLASGEGTDASGDITIAYGLER